MRTRFRGTAKGFTLIELVIVIAVMGILTALAVPRFAGASVRYRVQLAADRVARDIEYMRQRAISLGAQQTISFTPGQESYTMVGVRNPDTSAASYTVSLAAEPYAIESLNADFGGIDDLTFNGFGVPASGGTVSVRAGRYTGTVTVNAGSGACMLGVVESGGATVEATKELQVR